MKTSPDLNLSGLDVLIVEDDAASALLISRILSKYGARVETAANGDTGLLKFQEQRFPIIVTDICMPGMDGLELARKIRALDHDVQIIATSANSETGSLVSAIELGFSEYLLKPIEIDKLLLSVKRCGDIIAVKQQLENERVKFKTVVECLGEGIAIKDLNFRILHQNRAMTEMFSDLTGSACYKIFGLEHPCQDCPTVQALKDGQTHSSCRSYQIDGASIHIESTASLMRDSHGIVTGTVEIIRDISERIKNEQTIHNLAFLDPLTGLSNRRLFEDRLEQAIAKSRRYNMQFGLLTLDLDYFKKINDTFGHEAGDQVLLEAAERIRACCKRDLDTISRQGGDEFCIIYTDCGDRKQLTSIAEKLLVQFARPFQLTDALLEVTTSIGISIFPDNGSVMKELKIASDRAMYAAKKGGRNTYRFWEPYAVPVTTVV
jgi:diguanylate cyclase (GGDEF)-like protein/PAS domain S-box-containing protein